MKYFRMSYEEVVFNRSYINVILLSRSIPSYNTDNDKDDDDDKQEQRHRGKKVEHKFRHETELFSSLM